MTQAKLLPVIDLLNGQVVRGIAGERDHYQPVQSVLCDSARPSAIAAAFAAGGADQCYVADLDAILRGAPSFDSIQAVIDAGLQVWLDAGFDTLPRWPIRLTRALHSAVLGSETISTLERLQAQIEFWGERAVVSLDLKHGALLGAWTEHSPMDLAIIAHQMGCRRFIVLDLASVGSGEGVATETLCDQLRSQFGDIELTSGGGVRDQKDVDHLGAHGCDYVLVASALHGGDMSIRAEAD